MEKIKKAGRFIARRMGLFLLGIDQAFKGLLFGGNPDQTLSSYFWEAEQIGLWSGRIMRPVVDFIFKAPFLDGLPCHCLDSFDSDTERTFVTDEILSSDIDWTYYRALHAAGDLEPKTLKPILRR